MLIKEMQKECILAPSTLYEQAICERLLSLLLMLWLQSPHSTITGAFVPAYYKSESVEQHRILIIRLFEGGNT